ncbi:MAG: glycosyltransferase family 4 protein [Sulfurimonas sp.]|jgi:glycosyltransferase involved in cell wall biosynthesis|nr:glycosyltransferase family 4 protein [Sulfurimonas sp.]
MRILLVHNQYQHRGGEDTVLESELKLLQKYGETVDTLMFNNDQIKSPLDKIKYGFYSFYNPESSRLLESKINDFSPDVIHVHNFFPIVSPALFYTANKHGIPIVMTLHNYRLICPNAMFFRDDQVCEACISKSFALDGVLHGCYRNSRVQTLFLASMTWFHRTVGTWHDRVDKYILLTQFAKNKFLHSSLKLLDTKMAIKSNFVEDRGFDLEKEDYSLFVGRLSKEKGIETLLEAFKNSTRKLVIVGTGPLSRNVEEYTRKYPNIQYAGFQSIDFIIAKLKKAKALIFTSIWFEGMPMTILEAFSAATPVICGDFGGPAEIVQDKKTGLVYRVGDSADLFKKVEWLYDHHSEHSLMCTNARVEFEKKYSEQGNYHQLLSIYKDVISDKKKNY